MSLHNDAKPAQPVIKLSKEEISDPYLVLEELFDFAHLPQLRSMLWDWLKATVTGGYNKSLSSRERENILLLYEKVEKLIEAAHVLQGNSPHQKKNRRKKAG